MKFSEREEFTKNAISAFIGIEKTSPIRPIDFDGDCAEAPWELKQQPSPRYDEEGKLIQVTMQVRNKTSNSTAFCKANILYPYMDERQNYAKAQRIALISAIAAENPNFVQIESYVETAQWGYLFMEYLDPAEWEDTTNLHNFSAQQALQVCRLVAPEIVWLNKKGIAHNDLRTSNFFISKDRKKVKIADFDIAEITSRYLAKKLYTSKDPYLVKPTDMRGLAGIFFDLAFNGIDNDKAYEIYCEATKRNTVPEVLEYLEQAVAELTITSSTQHRTQSPA